MANNFTADSHCKALWNMEETSGTRDDSISTNTLTDVNTVTYDDVYFRQGVRSALFTATNSEYLGRLNADLSAGFPLKTSDSIKTISICAYFRLASLPAEGNYMIIYSKYSSSDNKRSFLLGVSRDATNTHVSMAIGYSGGTVAEIKHHTYALTTGVWYHVTGTFKDSDKTYSIRLKDENGTTLGTDNDSTFTNNINLSDTSVRVGAYDSTPSFFFNGQIDEVAVFDDIITAAEDIQIAQGNYGIKPYYAYAQQ